VTVPPGLGSSTTAASGTDTNTTSHGATVDAANEALFPGAQPESVAASGDQLVAVNSTTTLFNGHKRLKAKE
jgi:hypothetical protein